MKRERERNREGRRKKETIERQFVFFVSVMFSRADHARVKEIKRMDDNESIGKLLHMLPEFLFFFFF